MTTLNTAASSGLAAALTGPLAERLHLPGSPDYDRVRTPWNVAVDLRPLAVVQPVSTEEVAAVVRAATDLGLTVIPQSTGHGVSYLEGRDLSQTVILKLDLFTGVEIDPERRAARVVGGTWWSDVISAAAQHGLTASHGSAGDVAVAGYVLGGGLSFYARQHGLASQAVRSFDVVTAAGELVRASATENPDLFWALRGGQGGLGVVVALEIDLLPYPTTYAGMLLWPATQARHVVAAWRDWAASAPESATTSLRLMSFPPLPELPPFLSGRQIVVIDGAIIAESAQAEAVLADLRGLNPEMDTFGTIPAAGLLEVHMDPPVPTPAVSGHAVLAALPDEAVEAFVATTEAGALMAAELRHLGGALRGGDGSASLVDGADGEFALYALAVTPTPEAVSAGSASAAALVAAMAPWSTAETLPTFVEGPRPTYGNRQGRLDSIRAQADPGGLWG